MNTERPTLVPGQIYKVEVKIAEYSNYYSFIFKCRNLIPDHPDYCYFSGAIDSNGSFSNGDSTTIKFYDQNRKIVPHTEDEEEWLNICISANKYISSYDALRDKLPPPPKEKIEDYVPKVIQDGEKHYIQMLIRGQKCHTCEKIMILKCNQYDLFPRSYQVDQEAQMKKGNLVYKTSVTSNERYICHECVLNNKAVFTCSLCKEEKSTAKIKVSIGDPAEYLCTDCYAVTPAKEWDEIKNNLQEDHRYDYE